MPPSKPSANKFSHSFKIHPTPLGVIGLFIGLTESTLGVVVANTSGGVQFALTGFVIVFPVFVAVAFFWLLRENAIVYQTPEAFGKDVDPLTYAQALAWNRTRTVTRTSDVKQEVTVFGNPDHFKLLFKATTASWSKSTKAMEVSGGCLVQVSTEFVARNGERAVAEALTYVPDATIQDESDGSGRILVRQLDTMRS